MRSADTEESLDAPRSRAFWLKPVFVLALVWLGCLSAVAGTEFVMPTAHAARTYPARDEHSTEKVTVAVDPYDVEDKA
jgi:hypothetical protein